MPIDFWKNLLCHMDIILGQSESHPGSLQCRSGSNGDLPCLVQAVERLQQPQRPQPRLAPHCGHPEVAEVPDGAEECAVLLHCQVPQLHGQHWGGRILWVHCCRWNREGEKEEARIEEEEDRGGEGNWKQNKRGWRKLYLGWLLVWEPWLIT